MFIVTRTLVFPQQRRISLAPLPDGREAPAAPPLIVTLELECDTAEEVEAATRLGEDVVKKVAARLQGKVHFADATRRIHADLQLAGLRVRSAAVTNDPLFGVKYVPEFGYVQDNLTEAMERAS